jgi:hypothetical protein
MASEKLVYYPTVTREPFRNAGRISDLIRSGKLFDDLGMPAFTPEDDRIMICGNPAMTVELSGYLEKLGFDEGANNRPGTFVIEKALSSVDLTGWAVAHGSRYIERTRSGITARIGSASCSGGTAIWLAIRAMSSSGISK